GSATMEKVVNDFRKCMQSVDEYKHWAKEKINKSRDQFEYDELVGTVSTKFPNPTNKPAAIVPESSALFFTFTACSLLVAWHLSTYLEIRIYN
ncbi:2464_t:CDS:2, partial [Gigaspora rosea]